MGIVCPPRVGRAPPVCTDDATGLFVILKRLRMPRIGAARLTG